jgi:hypothetical protein
MIFDLLNDLNQDCSFVEKINESSYVEKINESSHVEKINESSHINLVEKINESSHINHMDNSSSKVYHNLVTCIISEFDPIFQTFVAVPTITSLTESEKKLYLSQKIMEICSNIDESDSFYHDYGFSEKIMKPHLIQQGLQMHEKKVNHISSVYYLNEFYKKHFVITHQNIAYETTLKNYPKIYLSIQGRVKIIDEKEFNKGNLNDLFDKINLQNDIKKEMKSVYKMFLDPISKYKIDDLKEIAQDCNLSLKDALLNKNKVKGQLYEEINLYKLND